MQASKIIPRSVYAIKQGDELVRFQVRKVVTTQVRTGAKSSPHDFTSVVHGNIAEPDRPASDMTVSPETILGPYTEYSTLQARYADEKAAREKLDAEQEARCNELCEIFYALSRVARPSDPDPKSHLQTYRLYLRNTVEIRSDGIEPLLTALRDIVRLRAG